MSNRLLLCSSERIFPARMGSTCGERVASKRATFSAQHEDTAASLLTLNVKLRRSRSKVYTSHTEVAQRMRRWGPSYPRHP